MAPGQRMPVRKSPSRKDAGQGRETPPTTHIEGGFRKISTHQLVLSWWLYRESHITRRQLRVYFAAHEMAERRACVLATIPGARIGRRRPSFTLEELSALVGGRGAPEALDGLQSDLNRLSRLGLVSLTNHRIDFAASVDELALPDTSGFLAMLGQFQNQKRTVPVPRRMLRALAGGYGRAVTGVVIALMIRSLFWNKERGYRLDGRTKGSWIAETFGISRRAVTDARAQLIDLGWLKPLETPQWAANRWGSHDALNPNWSATDGQEAGSEIASPLAQNPAISASPDLNNSPSLSGNLKTRNPVRPGSKTGVYNNSGTAKAAISEPAEPSLRNVQAEDLASTPRLLALFEQAQEAGLIDRSEAAQLDFLAFAERARAHGTRQAALFMWLLRGKHTKFITQADEDAAHSRLRSYRASMAAQNRTSAKASGPRELSGDERFYLLCIQIAKQQRVADPFTVAMIGKKWTREHWDQVAVSYAAYKNEQEGETGWRAWQAC